MEATQKNRIVRSPSVMFIPRSELQQVLGFYVYIEPSLQEFRSKVVRFLMSPLKGWLVFGITGDVKLQNQLLKFLEEYNGDVALHSDIPVRLISTVESRCLSVIKDVALPRLSRGKGLSLESQNPQRDARSALVLKRLMTSYHLQGQSKRILTLLDRL